DTSENRIEVLADLRVREAYDPNAIGLEDLRAPNVIVREPFMLLAVDLDDELRGMTVEIGDISIEGNLPLEFRAMEARAAQLLPQNLLGARHILSETAGELATLKLHGMVPSPLPLSRRERGV